MKGKVCGDFCEFTLDKGHFITGENMKKLVKRSDVMQETLEAYCSCSCSCYGTCSCSTGQTNNSAALFQARYTQFYMDFVAIRMV